MLLQKYNTIIQNYNKLLLIHNKLIQNHKMVLLQNYNKNIQSYSKPSKLFQNNKGNQSIEMVQSFFIMFVCRFKLFKHWGRYLGKEMCFARLWRRPILGEIQFYRTLNFNTQSIQKTYKRLESSRLHSSSNLTLEQSVNRFTLWLESYLVELIFI